MPARLISLITGAVTFASVALHNVAASEVNVYAAASLTDVMKEIAMNYEKQGDDKVIFNFGASSLLVRQIAAKAPADIFFSADEATMDHLQKAGLIAPETRRDMLGNVLVVIVPNDSKLAIASAADLEKTQRIAIADPRAVPAGLYTREYLGGLGLWDKLESRIIPTENVRAALAAVESGNVDAGFVYRTDAKMSKKVKIAFTVPVGKGPAIRYPIAIIKDATNKKAAESFLLYLESVDTQKVFERYGFIVKF